MKFCPARHTLILWILALLLVSRPAVAEDPDIARLFVEHGLTGTLILSSLQTDQTFIHNRERAQQRLPCASTFKILNTLIALDRRVISGEDEVLPWDGRLHPFPNWNQDQTLTSAFRVSCVWCYQELARRIGAETYRTVIRQAAYGELREPFALTEFWLDGSLQISAIEQVEFLKQVLRRSLPFESSAYDALRRIMLVEQTPDFTLRAKTGWAMRATPAIGWYVGYVETSTETWVFATNLDVTDEQALSWRQRLTREALQAKGIVQ